MEVVLNGVDITEEVCRAEFNDYSAARCDSLLLFLNDEEKRIRKMNIKKGDSVRALSDEISSGVMYVSNITYIKNNVLIKALSAKITLFEEKTFYKNNISFDEMMKEISDETGCRIYIVNPLQKKYIDVTRNKQNPLSFLESRLSIEGYQFKIIDNEIIVYDEKKQEKRESVEDFTENDFESGLQFETKDAGMIASIENIYMTEGYTIKTYRESGRPGKKLQMSMAVNSIGESEEYSDNIMRKANMYEFTASGKITGLKMKSGQTVNIDASIKDFTGKYYIYKVTSELVKKNQIISMRKL